jgi:hypothetical protein
MVVTKSAGIAQEDNMTILEFLSFQVFGGVKMGYQESHHCVYRTVQNE